MFVQLSLNCICYLCKRILLLCLPAASYLKSNQVEEAPLIWSITFIPRGKLVPLRSQKEETCSSQFHSHQIASHRVIGWVSFEML